MPSFQEPSTAADTLHVPRGCLTVSVLAKLHLHVYVGGGGGGGGGRGGGGVVSAGASCVVVHSMDLITCL